LPNTDDRAIATVLSRAADPGHAFDPETERLRIAAVKEWHCLRALRSVRRGTDIDGEG
jgi:hypothetical protein